MTRNEPRRPSLPIDPQPAAELLAALTSALRAGADSPTPGPLLASAAMLLDLAAGATDPASTATLVRGRTVLRSWEADAG